MASLRHEFYETDERLTLSIFDKGVDADAVKIEFEPRKFSYVNGEKELVLQPLKGQIIPGASDYTVGKVKVEVRFAKAAASRWGALVGDAPDPLSSFPQQSSLAPESSSSASKPKPRKNWEGITTSILASEKEKTSDEDPNVGGDTAVNGFFQQIFANADDDTKKAMMKSYQESGGTTLSTNWDEVKQGKVEVKPPAGSEWKKWN